MPHIQPPNKNNTPSPAMASHGVSKRDLVTICAWCKKVLAEEDELTQSLIANKRISHGICQPCYEPMMRPHDG